MLSHFWDFILPNVTELTWPLSAIFPIINQAGGRGGGKFSSSWIANANLRSYQGARDKKAYREEIKHARDLVPDQPVYLPGGHPLCHTNDVWLPQRCTHFLPWAWSGGQENGKSTRLGLCKHRIFFFKSQLHYLLVYRLRQVIKASLSLFPHL